MRITIDFDGDVQFSRALLRFRDRAADMRPVLGEIADDFVVLERQQFTTQGAAASGGWAALKQETVDRKRAKNLDTKILHATHRLRDSLISRTSVDHVRKVTRDEVQIGTRVPYSVHHQHGAPRANLKQRRPVELSLTTRKAWVTKLQRFLVEGVAA